MCALLVNVVAGSLAWYERCDDGHTVCADCVRNYNGAVSVVSLEPADTHSAEPPPFMFRPVKEEQDDMWKHVRVHVCSLFAQYLNVQLQNAVSYCDLTVTGKLSRC